MPDNPSPAAVSACPCPDFRDPWRHGLLVRESRRDDEDCPIERYWTVERCSACGRRYEIETVGDSHKGYDFSIRELK